MGVAVAIGMGIIILQFALGPWLMDLALRWIYKFSWVPVEQLPAHLREFVTRVAGEQNMKVPSFGLIHDGAPNAFTYGHHPGNMRIVITQGILDLLEPEEVEGVVAHEIGHGKNWDMLLMTVVQLVPLLLYFLYRTAMQMGDRGKDGGYRVAVAVSAYVLYIVSEYVVLWFSRCREYYADRFAGNVTGNPGGARLGPGQDRLRPGGPRPITPRAAERSGSRQEGQEKEEGRAGLRHRRHRRHGNFRPKGGRGDGRQLGFTRASTVPVRAPRTATVAPSVSKENLKSAMQWDLWNPWATFYELNSTHPLIAHRLQYLSDQGAAMGQEPYIVFDRRKPESYWDDFAVDVLVILLPLLLFLVGLGVALALGAGAAFGVLPGALNLGPPAGLVLCRPADPGARNRLADQDDAGLPRRSLRAAFGHGSLAQGQGLERPPGAGPAARHDHRQGRSRPDLVRRLRDARCDRNPVPGLPPAAQDLGMALRALSCRRIHRQDGRGRRLVPARPVPYLELKSITVDGVTRNSYARHGRYFLAGLGVLLGIGLVVAGLIAG